MQTLRKNIIRRPWLLAMLGFLLLALNQQAVACGLMMVLPDQSAQHCPDHDGGTNQKDPSKKSCCDFLFEFSAAGSCQNDHGTVINSSLSGKFNPDISLFVTVNLQHVFPDPRSTLPIHIPARESSRPGAQTYLITQRLRI